MAFFRCEKRKGHGPFWSSFLPEKAKGKRSHAPCLISKIAGWKMKGDVAAGFSRRASASVQSFFPQDDVSHPVFCRYGSKESGLITCSFESNHREISSANLCETSALHLS